MLLYLRRLGPLALTCTLASSGCGPRAEPPSDGLEQDGFEELFNGRDLTGWVPKIRGEQAGQDARGTFRVEDGMIVVSYDGYDVDAGFDDAFGHLFFEAPFERYELIVEYRFVGEQFAGGPEWARSNSGVMFHAQDPQTMGLAQDFPVSLEAQFLGARPGEVRPTANLCTPGTHVSMEGVEVTRHCVEADAPSIPDSTWVTMTVRVHADGSIEHLVGADVVLHYSDPVVGGGEANGTTDAAPPPGTSLAGGYIALQSESHPIHFRRVALRRLR